MQAGPDINSLSGGIRNVDNSQCPDMATGDWQYWADWLNSWEDDWTMTATCGNDVPTVPTTLGPV